MRYTVNDAWHIVSEFAEYLQHSSLRVQSVVVYNSLVRGDFVENRSDVDVMAVVEKKHDSELAKRLYADFCERYGCGDEPRWELAKDILPLDFYVYTVRELRNHDFGIYYCDFMENHKILLGKDLMNLITRPNPKEAALKFLSEAVTSSRDWSSPRRETIKRHLGWLKFHPAYLAIECMKAVLLYHDIRDFNRNRMIANLKRIPDFRDETLAEIIMKLYLEDRTRHMGFEKVEQLYPGVRRFICQINQLVSTTE